MTKKDAAELLDLAIAKAPELRKAGILEIAVGDLRFELAAHVPAPTEPDDDEDDDQVDLDVLDDPTTFGRQRSVPGGTRADRKARR